MLHNKELIWRYLRRGLIALLAIYLAFVLRQTMQLMLGSLFFAGAITPLVESMEKYRIRRGVAISIIYLGVLLIIVLTIAPAPRIIAELGLFFTNLPELVKQIPVPTQPIFNIDPQRLTELLQPKVILDQVQAFGKELASQTVNFTLSLINALGVTLLSMLITGYMVVHAKELLRKVLRPFAPEVRAQVYTLIPPITRCLGAYVLGRIGTSALLGFCTYLALAFLNVPFAGALGLLVAVSNLIPFVGPILGLIPMVIAAWGMGVGKVIAVVGISFVLQQIEAFILQPWLVGPYLNLDPFELLLSIIVGAELLGVVGAIIAPPVAGIGRILFNHFYGHKLMAEESDSLDALPSGELQDGSADAKAISAGDRDRKDDEISENHGK
ncbi:AI-2E family transporter [Pseudanabaena sp. PCC 6802]|uniref:AI-2E family transporter n=1 Tax=Pseudanabaena sp. PCC 6802 TaxID=118173 RepID=UPI000365B6F3|nr:AI-2E family transporter [Pseudanabaena sp. PCC 6802]